MNMRHRNMTKWSLGAVGLLTVGTILVNTVPSPAAAADFANPAFKRVWDRTDALVASGQVSRTFFWGPQPNQQAQEQYLDAPGGTSTRLVQYFDKSRMELNNPNADPNSPFYVTNGLLTEELISGQMQIGNNAFIQRYQANIPISGDTDDVNAPTYATFASVSNTRLGDHPQPDRTGQNVTATINKAGQVGDDPTKSTVAGVKVVYYEPSTKHNIPEVFWNFLNATGPISQTGQIVNQRLIDPWFYASGLPISDPYWASVKISGTQANVLIQAYERRVLTYVPTNPPGFQVEMGNIGLHYFDWRYKDAGKATGTVVPATGTVGTVVATSTVAATATGTPATATRTASVTATAGTPSMTATGTPPTSTATASPTANVVTQGYIAFTSDREGGNKDIFRIKGDGTSPVNLSHNPAADDDAAYSPDGSKIAFDSTRDNNDREIYVMNSDGSGPTRLTNSPGPDYAPTWSPDGSKIAFVSERNSNLPDIYVMNANGTGQVNITQAPGTDNWPSWGANNSIVFASNRSGKYQIYTINSDGTGFFGPITTAGENIEPQWNKLANRIAFVSNRDGHNEIYTMRPGGEEQFRLTTTADTVSNYDPTYAPDNSEIAFDSDRIGTDNLELFTMNIDGSNQNRITIYAGKDYHPSWIVPGAFLP